MFNNMYYWDNSSSNVMIELDLEKKDNLLEFNSNISRIKKIHDLFKKGYIDKNEDINDELFEALKEHILASAKRYYLTKKRPFILLNIKYDKLSEFEIKCIFEYIIHTPDYLHSKKHGDIIYFTKVGWWFIEEMINKYKDQVKFRMDDYSYESNNNW